MQFINTIVLSAGKDQNNWFTSSAMTSVRGKPAIAWCLSSIMKNNITDLSIVIRKENKKLKTYLSKNTSLQKNNILVIEFDDNKEKQDNILTSLNLALKRIENNNPVQIILADTMIDGKFPEEEDVFLTSQEFETSNRWCLVSKDETNHIKEFFDKKVDISIKDKELLIGFYKLSNIDLLKSSVEKALLNNKKDLSDAFDLYMQKQPIKLKPTDKWLDFGHISGIVNARLKLFNAREFNNISVNPITGTIVKSSTKIQKLKDEVNWYKSLPKKLSVLACFWTSSCLVL